jgi:hypothetical protein
MPAWIWLAKWFSGSAIPVMVGVFPYTTVFLSLTTFVSGAVRLVDFNGFGDPLPKPDVVNLL